MTTQERLIVSPQAALSGYGPYIDGRRLSSTGAGTHGHINPATGRVQAQVSLAGDDEIDGAIVSARRASKVWRDLHPSQRARILHRLADLVDAHAEELSILNSLETGHPFRSGGIQLASAWIRYYAGWCDKIEGQVASSLTLPGFHYILPEPYGVVAAVIPWNAPIVACAMKVFPALAAGNAVVLKPPELTPFGAVRLAELASEAGVPPGAFNVVPSTGSMGARLIRHPGIDKVSFTGGAATARLVMAVCAETLKPLALELGGKSASIIFADADLDRAVPQSLAGCLTLSGQGCVNPTRMLVHESVYDDVLSRVIALTKDLKLGAPFDPETSMGPVISVVCAP
jgi:aldehyde dehydrogenase (NAD+)